MRRGRACLPCAVLLLATAAAHAQPTPNVNRTVELNYVYAADLGFGGYRLSGLSASVYTLPLSYPMDDAPYKGWTVDFLFPVQVGLYRFRATDVDGQQLALDQQSVSVVPGIELRIPVSLPFGESTVLKPFAQFGVAHAFGDDVGNPNSWIYLTGARTLTEWHAGAYTLSVGTAAIFAGDQIIGPGFSERYISLQTGFEVRHPLGFRVGSIEPDVGMYIAGYYYPQALKFTRFLKRTLFVSEQGEIGFSVGSATPYKLLWLPSPRIGLGYVFGGGLQVWHVNFGFRF